MAVKLLEPGGDADFVGTSAGGTNSFWTRNSGAVAVATDFVHGGHVKSLKYRPATNDSIISRTAILDDAGRRISFYVYIAVLPTGTRTLVALLNNGLGTYGALLKVTSSGVLQLMKNDGTTQIGSNGATLSTGTWYRICLSYTITSSSVNRFEVFVNAVSSISATNASSISTGSDTLLLGSDAGSDATWDFRTSDHYVDDSSALTDTGDIWVTAKRPNANGTTNNFSTQIGAGGSGYGTGHSPQVNERALSTTNGWSIINAGSAVTEEYNIESKATGDIAIGSGTIIDWMGWVSIKALTTETISIVLDGANVSQGINTTITLYTAIKGSSTYPSGGGADIGVITSNTVTTVSLYECGIVVAFIPSTNTDYTQTLTETITLTDTVFGSASRILTEAITLTASVFGSVARVLTESFSISDTLTNIHGYAKTLTETITLTDTIASRAVTRVLTETITFTASVYKTLGRILTESITLTDVFSYFRNIFLGVVHMRSNQQSRPKAMDQNDLGKMRSNQQTYPKPMDDSSIK